ncbi:phosphoribosyltransferase family protein [Burkholderia ubonensis]|uniref:phosphoribosyltransferase family protein n=1 Tax=Burkholderia ubonensis TaxID=101571 RepID=UPI00358DDA38
MQVCTSSFPALPGRSAYRLLDIDHEYHFSESNRCGQAARRSAGTLRRGSDVVVLALPRGGLPVGYQVARQLRCPFDVLVVRKLGAPQNPELAIGAIATAAALYLNESVLRAVPVTEQQVLDAIVRERITLERRELASPGTAAAGCGRR